MQHILVPIGSTESAQNTLQYAINFASDIDAKVLVFRAYSSQTKAGTMKNVDSVIERETNLYLRTMVSSVDRKNVDVKRRFEVKSKPTSHFLKDDLSGEAGKSFEIYTFLRKRNRYWHDNFIFCCILFYFYCRIIMYKFFAWAC